MHQRGSVFVHLPFKDRKIRFDWLCWWTQWPDHQQMHAGSQIGWPVWCPIQGWMMSGGLAYWLRLSKSSLSYRPWVDDNARPWLGWSFQPAKTLRYERENGPAPPRWTRWCEAWLAEQVAPVTHLNQGVYLHHLAWPWRFGGRWPVPLQTCRSPWWRVPNQQRLVLCGTAEGMTLGPRCG